jgi:hypothetical protein
MESLGVHTPFTHLKPYDSVAVKMNNTGGINKKMDELL